MIHHQCQERIMKMGDDATIRRGLVDMFNAASKDAQEKDLPSATLVVPYYDDQCNLQPGDWAAELHLVVRKVVSPDEAEAAAAAASGDQTVQEGEAAPKA